MAKPVFYLETESTDPAYNLAFEEYVLKQRKDGDYLLLWQNDRTVVVGQNQNVEEEIDRAFVDAHNIRVVRRATGGGAVYHDLGNLNYSFITDAGDPEQLTLSRFVSPVVSALRALGLDAEASGRNDITVGGRKVSGTAQRLTEDRLLHHGTLLFDADTDMASRALRADPQKFQSKSVKSVHSRIGNIRPALKSDMTLPAFWIYLRNALSGDGFVPAALRKDELAEVQSLKAEKYETWDWIYGRSPRYEMQNQQRFVGGTLKVQMTIKKGYIAGIAFYGDFLSMRPLDTVTQALTGCPFRPEAVHTALSALPIHQYFGRISEQEITSVMFNR